MFVVTGAIQRMVYTVDRIVMVHQTLMCLSHIHIRFGYLDTGPAMAAIDTGFPVTGKIDRQDVKKSS